MRKVLSAITAVALLLGVGSIPAGAVENEAVYTISLSSTQQADGSWSHTALYEGEEVPEYDYVWRADPSEVHDEVKDSPAEYYTGETSDGSDPVYIAHDIYYYPELDVDGFQKTNYDGSMEWVYHYTAEGYEDYIFSTLPVTGAELPTEMMHSEEEAYENAVLHITQPGTYILEGNWHGQIWIDLGDTDDTFADESAKVTLILNGVDVTCTVAPALVFYSVYECDNTWEDQTAWSEDVDTSDAGARVVIADGTENNFSGTNIYRSLKTKYKDDTETTQKKRLKIDGAFYSYVSMEVEGGEIGDGILNIDAGFEGLDTELHLTLNGGNINIISQDDGINVNEDGVSVVTINGGSLHIVAGVGSEGDGIDSNGFLVINGGVVIATANPASDSGLDSDMGSYINGGYVVATGSTMDWAESDSEQVTMNLQFSSMQNSDEAIIVTDLEGHVIFAYDPDKDETTGTYVRSYQGAVISCPQFQVGETYHIYVGGDVDGTEVNGLYDAATVTGFTDQAKLQSYTGTDVGMGRPGGMGGGMSGGAGGGMNPQFQGVTDNGDGTISVTQEGASSILSMIQQRNPETTVTVEDILACDTYQALMELAGMGGRADGEFPEGMEPGERPEDMEPGDRPEGMEPGERPEDMNSGRQPGDDNQGETGLASTEFYMTDKVNAFSGVADADDAGVQTGFTDVSKDSWYYEAVSFIAEQGLMTGTSTTAFSPDETTTRGMAATILYRLAGSQAGGSLSFADVADGTWYADAVAWVASQGIMGGYGSGLFGPEDNITREQLAAILYRYAQVKGYDVSAGEDTNSLSYTDALEISEYAIPAMQWACGAGILEGNDGALNPKGDATRAEVATLLMRFCEYCMT